MPPKDNPVVAPAPSMAEAANAAADKAVEQASAPKPDMTVEKPSAPTTLEERLSKLREAAPEIPVRFKHEDVNVPFDQARDFIQKGMAITDIEKAKEELKGDKEAFKAYQDFQKFLRNNPDRAQEIAAIYEGRVAPTPRTQRADPEEYEDDSETPAANQAILNAIRDLQAKNANLEAQVNQTRSQFHRRDFEGQLADAVASQPFLSSNPDAADMARKMIAAEITSGEYQTPAQAAPSVATRLKRMAETEMENIRKQRERQQSEGAPVMSGAGSPAPKFEGLLEKLDVGVKGMRRGNVKQELKNAFNSFRRSATSGPP